MKEQIAAQQSHIAAQNNLMHQIHCALPISGIQFPDVEPSLETTSQPPATAATTSQPPNTATTPLAGNCNVEDYFF
ncbi:hypothetical protein ACFX1W_009078 [Malus domestica]